MPPTLSLVQTNVLCLFERRLTSWRWEIMSISGHSPTSLDCPVSQGPRGQSSRPHRGCKHFATVTLCSYQPVSHHTQSHTDTLSPPSDLLLISACPWPPTVVCVKIKKREEGQKGPPEQEELFIAWCLSFQTSVNLLTSKVIERESICVKSRWIFSLSNVYVQSFVFV